MEENAFPRLSFHGVDRHFPSVLQMGRSSGTPPLIRIRARHRCELAKHRFVKAKAIAERRRKLRIPRFRPRAKSSVTSLLLLSPPNPPAAGLRRGPRFGTRSFQRTMGSLACLSLLSFFTRRKMASPKGVPLCKAANWFWSSRILHSLSNCSASIPPSAVADTSLYTREALVLSNTANAEKHETA